MKPRDQLPVSVRAIAPLVIVAITSVLLATSTIARAQSVPAVTDTAPLVLQRGQSETITLHGQHLARVNDLAIASARGLKATLLRPHPETQATTQPAAESKPSDSELRLALSADADASLGDRELRLVGPTGVSSPVHVTISQYPHVPEHEPNNAADQAQAVTLPATITGRIDAAGDVDCFRFNANKNEQIVVDVHAARSGSPLEPVVTVHDGLGHELAPRIDAHGSDPTVIFKAPAAGQYEVEIRDLEFRGGGQFFYRIDAGAIPYLQAVMPMGAQPGRIAEVRPIGVNLNGLDQMPLDLTYASTGQVGVRARVNDGGVSNEVPFEINELPAYLDQGSNNHAAAQAARVPFPIEISGNVDSAGDEDFYRFHVDRKQLVTLEVAGRRLGSPIDALLTLRNDKGDPIMTNDDAGGPDARISRDLDAGDYIASVRDLTYHGGPAYAYRLRIAGGTAASGQDFAVRFAPDAIRVSRGGNAVVLCDVQRTGGFKGDVTVTVEGLPPGVRCPPVTLPVNSSDLFTISADPGAAAVLGTYPITLRAAAVIDNHMIVKTAQPMLGSEPVRQAYLTVMEAAPFTIEALEGLSPQRVQQLAAEAATLRANAYKPDPTIAAAEAEWEGRIASPLVWESLDAATVKSADGSEFKRLPDGSFLATGKTPDHDTYTVTAPTHLKGITAIRLEVLPDDSLPEKGPGRHAGDGNFVLSHFTASAAPEAEPGKSTPIAIASARAHFDQTGYGVTYAVNPAPNKGWAMYPNKGQPNAAFFFAAAPVGDGSGTVLTFSLEQKFEPSQFVIGRFRISVTTDPDAQIKSALPASMLNIAQLSPDRRTPAQRAELANFYYSTDPQIVARQKRYQEIDAMVGPYAEMARLEAAFKAVSPQVDAARTTWESRVRAGEAWLPLDFSEMKSVGGAQLLKYPPEESIFVVGPTPAIDTYTLVAPAPPIRRITAIRLEALSDPRLPGNGPGRSPGGNFVLTKFNARTTDAKGGAVSAPIEFRGASATFEQQGFRALGAIDDRDDTGWAVAPGVGVPSSATFYPAEPIVLENGSRLSIDLEQKFAGAPQHTLGHFRIWVTGSATPDSAQRVPLDVLAAMRVVPDKRDRQQKAIVEAFYRTSADASVLEPLRERLTELKTEIADRTQHAQYRDGSVAFLLNRNDRFDGEVQVTLEGFSIGRRRPLEQNLKFEPVRLARGTASGALPFTVQPAAEQGTRLAVLKAESKIGDETYVEYSPAFPLTVTPAR